MHIVQKSLHCFNVVRILDKFRQENFVDYVVAVVGHDDYGDDKDDDDEDQILWDGDEILYESVFMRSLFETISW